MSDPVPARYAVYGEWTKARGSSTFLCDTPEQALKILSDFKSGEYTAVVITVSDGTRITEADLQAQQSAETECVSGGPVAPDTLSAPALLAIAA